MFSKRPLQYITVLLPFVILLTGCPYGYKYDEGKLPEHPVNLTDLNSEYDDRNMPAPWIEVNHPAFFSSNRLTQGDTYDLVWDHLFIEWDKDTGVLTVDNREGYAQMNYSFLDSLLIRTRTPGNEYGPFALNYTSYFDNPSAMHDVLIYADDMSGNFDMQFIHFESWSDFENGSIHGPFDVKFLNTGSDEYYPSLWGEGVLFTPYIKTEFEKVTEVYFSSNREGGFDIYKTFLPGDYELLEILKLDTTLTTQKVEILSSGGEDKCPFANGKLLVFASDREGGFGGYDLYYSLYQNGGWSAPINFGDKINTAFNEFRPVAVIMWEFNLDLLLFSSDRPGGKGGYDLYYVGIPKMMEEI